MPINDMDFFHQATIRICGSLKINRVLEDCFEYLRQFIPLDAIYMNTYDPDLGAILSIANKSEFPERLWNAPVVLSPEARAYVEGPHSTRVEITNRPENHIIGRVLWNSMKIKEFSVMVMFLEIDEEDLGVVEFVCKGRGRYVEEHARLLELLHDPFAVAMSNTLRYQVPIVVPKLICMCSKDSCCPLGVHGPTQGKEILYCCLTHQVGEFFQCIKEEDLIIQ